MITDDYGERVYPRHALNGRGEWSAPFIWASDCKWTPCYMPGVKGNMLATKDYDNKPTVRAFHESEANCNTCKHLVRVKHPKDPLGFLFGGCASKPDKHIYRQHDIPTEHVPITFHPDDPMHMACYVPRW